MKAASGAATRPLSTVTIMPLPIAAGVLGMQRTIGTAPSTFSRAAIGVPAAMLRKVVPPSAKRR